MDLPPPEELQSLSIPALISHSIQIPKQSPRTFYLITLTLIFPLSFAILAHSLFTHPLFSRLSHGGPNSDWTKLLLFQLCYLIFLFAFSLLSTAAVVFTVASLYASKPVSFGSTFAALPPVLRRLFVTYLYVSFFMLMYYAVMIVFLLLLIIAVDTDNTLLFLLSFVFVLVLFLGVHVYMTALWHLASVVSVLEPIYGFSAMKKAYVLLKGRTRMACVLVFVYLAICGVITGVFGSIVVRGGDGEYGAMTRIVVGGFLVGVLVIVNLLGLMVQSVFYYMCKGYHHQGIDKSALYDHLGGYLGEYVPLKSNIQMENIDV